MPHRSSRLVVATTLAALALAGCSSGGGDDAAETTAATTVPAASEAADQPAEDATEEPAEDEPEVDDAGAAEVAEVTTDLLDEVRELVDGVDGSASNASVQGTVREIRNAAFDADADLRELEVADPDLAEAVGDLLTTIANSIGAFDESTTVAPEAVTAELAASTATAEIELLAAAADVQEAALAVEAGEPVPEGPALSEVLPTDEEAAGEGFLLLPSGNPTVVEEGPCGEPSAFLAVPPRSFAAVSVQDPQVSGTARVLAFADEDEAGDYVDAVAAVMSCDEPEGFVSSEVDLEEGDRVESIDVTEGDEITTTIVAERVGSRVVVVVRTGDLLSLSADAEAITGDQADDLVDLMVAKAEG